MIFLNPGAELDTADLSEKEILVLEALLSRKKLAIGEVADIAGQKKIIPLVNNLIEKGLVFTEEKLVEKYQALTESYVFLSDELKKDEDALRKVFDELNRKAFKQLQALMALITLAGGTGPEMREVRKKDLLRIREASIHALSALVKKKIVEVRDVEVSRIGLGKATASVADILLSDHQLKALGQVKKGFSEKEIVLLHGITSSGKTEIYIKLIEEALSRKEQVLYLLPEIALTSQIINRLRRYFGDRVGVYHSRYNDSERVEIWNHCLALQEGFDSGRFQVILGARSALFLPFSRLGLVIADEEHDTSYKQHDPAPRYQARDAAIMLARMHGARVLLGSATPSIESYFNALAGKYALVGMTERFGGISMPEILTADIRDESRKRTMQSHFSSQLIGRIRAALQNGEQVILFQNRRGFSPHLACDACDWIPMCRHCDISLTYHKKDNRIKCHYCGYSEPVPSQCPQCGSTRILTRGFGTEKVEEDLAVIFPETAIRRMDLDSTRTKFAHHRIITDFEDRKIQVLIGTQMVTKGLDFDNVSLVGILNADNMINFPDFRSHERSFQMMEQVSGRAGRKGKQGQVVIQSFNPSHPLIGMVVRHDYPSFFEAQLRDRERFLYPPYSRLIRIQVKHADATMLNRAAGSLAEELRARLGKRVLGPEYPIVARIRGLYIKQILIKLERGSGLAAQKEEIRKAVESFRSIGTYRQVKVAVDVDPQ
jgi:primosomal protein N' (replication factor Y)